MPVQALPLPFLLIVLVVSFLYFWQRFSMPSTPKQLTAAELLKHPEFPHIIWDLKPEKKGFVTCGGKRAYKIAYEVHGTGPRRLVLVMGLGEFMTSWMRQTKDFGHTKSSEYTVLLVDNRGVGESDRPLFKYSTANMAEDVVEVLNHLGWTAPRSVHVCGVSMGGMIAQEIAYQIPERISSLALISTAPRLISTGTWWDGVKIRVGLLLPKTLDERIRAQKVACNSAAVLTRPDEEEHVAAPFPTMGDRLGASELHKRRSKGRFTTLGFLAQAVACAHHLKTPEQLRQLADRVGRGRILVVHGTADRTLTPAHAELLLQGLNDGVKPGEQAVQARWFEGQNHVVIVEMRSEFNEILDGFIRAAERADDRGTAVGKIPLPNGTLERPRNDVPQTTMHKPAPAAAAEMAA